MTKIESFINFPKLRVTRVNIMPKKHMTKGNVVNSHTILCPGYIEVNCINPKTGQPHVKIYPIDTHAPKNALIIVYSSGKTDVRCPWYGFDEGGPVCKGYLLEINPNSVSDEKQDTNCPYSTDETSD